jgi:type II secretory pathway pseudopilin PulG
LITIAMLAAIALPQYFEYVQRAQMRQLEIREQQERIQQEQDRIQQNWPENQ